MDSNSLPLVPQKVCKLCQQPFPATLEFFFAHKQQKDGLQPRCKACFGQGRKQREGYVDGKKRCRHCNNYFLATPEFFTHNHTSADNLSPYCRECDRKKSEHGNRQRGQKPRNPRKTKEQEAQRLKLWYQQGGKHVVQANTRNRRARLRQAEGRHTAQDIQAQYSRQKGKCYYCHKKLGDSYHVDHIIPVTRGGSNDPSNLVIACAYCNVSKNDRLPHEWPQGGRLL